MGMGMVKGKGDGEEDGEGETRQRLSLGRADRDEYLRSVHARSTLSTPTVSQRVARRGPPPGDGGGGAGRGPAGPARPRPRPSWLSLGWTGTLAPPRSGSPAEW
eukprot:886010-Prorocentrum_minimum.AAC.1